MAIASSLMMRRANPRIPPRRVRFRAKVGRRAELAGDLQDLESHLAGRHIHFNDIAGGSAEKGLPDGAGDGEAALSKVCLLLGNERIRLHATRAIVLHAHGRKDISLTCVDLLLIYESSSRHDLLDLRDARFEMALLFFRRVIFGVLRQVALLAGLLDGARDPGALFHLKELELLL